MDDRLRELTRRWAESKRDEEARARERAALQLASGLDLDAALSMTGEGREHLMRRLRRLLERERLRAARPEAEYSLDRHIALKRALDRLAGISPSLSGYAPRRRRRRAST